MFLIFAGRVDALVSVGRVRIRRALFDLIAHLTVEHRVVGAQQTVADTH